MEREKKLEKRKNWKIVLKGRINEEVEKSREKIDGEESLREKIPERGQRRRSKKEDGRRRRKKKNPFR